MVWSDGEDPETGDPVVMYDWIIQPFSHPWKVKSPVTGKLYPTNDFKAFHDSGLDERGFFDPALADRTLLFNTDHPDPDDPLHLFGVDDGEGYWDGTRRWRFIGAYLVHGQWKRWIHAGIVRLSEGYMVTGDIRYARKAAILLDRLADVYPEFDYATQGLVYELPGRRGAISVWHDAAREIRSLALAYDQIFEAISRDQELVDFLASKAAEHGLVNPKSDFALIQENIESRLFRETLRNPDRILTNFPGHLITILIIETVLEWPMNRGHVLASLQDILEQSIVVGGLTGERGIQGYTRGFPNQMAVLLQQFDRLDPNLLPDLFERLQDLRKTWRFYVDTKILELFYPAEGDSGHVGRRFNREVTGPDGTPSPPPHHYYYLGVNLPQVVGSNVDTCLYRFLWRLYELTGDADYVRIIRKANGDTLEAVPKDVYGGDHAAFQQQVRDVLDQEGREIILGDVNLQEWGISILRAGNGQEGTALALLHDVSGSHRHYDGLNIELFHRGLNLLPDLGYPPVAYPGGWTSSWAWWFKNTASHNTVVVDGKDQGQGSGTCTLWAPGRIIHGVRVEAPDLYRETDLYERLLLLIETGQGDAYVVDSFAVRGGHDHIRSCIPFFSEPMHAGLTFEDVEFDLSWPLQNVRSAGITKRGWHADWKIEDRYGYLPEGGEIHLRYTGLSDDVEVLACDSWTDTKLYGGIPDWLPRLMERRRDSEGGLVSHFMGVLEPNEGTPFLDNIDRRHLLPVGKDVPESILDAAIVITLVDGSTDVVAITGNGSPAIEWGVQGIADFKFKGEVAFARFDPEGSVTLLALMNGTSILAGQSQLGFEDVVEFVEARVEDGVVSILTQIPLPEPPSPGVTSETFSVY